MTTNDVIQIMKENTQDHEQWFTTCLNALRCMIRVDGILHTFCPITYVAYKKGWGVFNTMKALSLGQELGLSKREASNIIGAADDANKDHSDLRKDFMVSVNLEYN